MRFYLDTEFNGYGGTLISLALVAGTGASLYLINEDFREGAVHPIDRPEIDTWVAGNVLPILLHCPVLPRYLPLDGFGPTISTFLDRNGDAKPPQIIADWPSDIADFCTLLLTGPGTAVPMGHQTHFTIVRHIDVYPTDLPGAVQHNAWWDAMALRHFITLSERA